MYTTIHVRMLVVGEPFHLLGFLTDVKSRHGSNPFSFNRIIRMPIPVPDDDRLFGNLNGKKLAQYKQMVAKPGNAIF